MSELFPGIEKTYIVSPHKRDQGSGHPQRDEAADGSRDNLMRRMHAMLEAEDRLRLPKGRIIGIRRVKGIIKRPDYWGGDGIAVTVAAHWSGQDLYEALSVLTQIGRDMVVLDTETGRLYGKEAPSATVLPFPVRRPTPMPTPQ